MEPTVDAIEAVKAMAEMTYIFFKHLLETGATISEATSMTSAYIQALISSGNQQKSGDSDGDS